MKIKTVKSGVTLGFIKNSRFKASLLTVRFILPLNKYEVTENAMAADIISECSLDYPTPEALQLALSKLYGADIYCSLEKSGDNQVISFSLKCLDDKYGIDGEECFREATHILKGMLFSPDLEGGVFKKAAVDRVRRRQIDIINSEINDKRVYAKNRLEEAMFQGEAYGVPRLGYAENVKSATPEQLISAYKRLIESSEVRITYVGSELPQYITDFAKSFPDTVREKPVSCTYTEPKEVRELHEKLDVTQGKLVMGFRTSEIGSDRDTVSTAVAVDVFGGGPYSKLFSEVREKQSLCYYCSARALRKNGFITVESGVEDANAQKAKQEILAQLEAIKQGDFSEELIEASKRSICDSLNSVEDSIGSIDFWYGARLGEEKPLSPKEFAQLVNSVTREQIISSAKKIKADTFYFLESQKAGDGND